MQPIFDIVTAVSLGLGCLLAVTGALGVLRMPDFYSRLHPAGKTDSLAQVLIMTGLLFQCFRYPTIGPGAAVRLLMITAFILLTSPVATHAIAKAAYLGGLRPWQKRGDPDV
jgi:multicomponent Na+:H+ antiporter subunit G